MSGNQAPALEDVYNPQRTVDEQKVSISAYCLIDGCGQFIVNITNAFPILDRNKGEGCILRSYDEARGEVEIGLLAMRGNIADKGGWILYHAAELLAELVVARTALQIPGLAQFRSAIETWCAGDDNLCTSALGIPWADNVETVSATIGRALSALFPTFPADDLMRLGRSIALMCFAIPRSILTLRNLAMLSENRNLSAEQRTSCLHYHLDQTIESLGELVTNSVMLSLASNRFWSFYHDNYPFDTSESGE